jgi:superfamily II DNA or RNA helicase
VPNIEPERTALSDEPAWFRALREQVHPTTFKKGRQYAEAGRVQSVAVKEAALSGRVSGAMGPPYEVKLDWSGDALVSTCNCEAWNKYGPHCKHVVAAALVNLEKPEQREEVREVAAAEPMALPTLAKLENWLGLSAQPDYEFLYRLTAARSVSGARQWILDVRRVDAQGKGPVQTKRVMASGGRVAPADERIFVELSRHESRYDGRILLADSELADLFELLRYRRVIYRGTALLFSPEPARIQIHLQSHKDAAVAKIQFALPEGNSLSAREGIVLSGKRTYLLAGQTLYSTEPDFPSRLLRKWLLEPDMSFPASQLDRLLTFFAAHLPRFRIALKADGIEVDESVEPAIILTAEGGAETVKAVLAARYGQSTVPVSPLAGHLGYASGSSEGGRKLYRRRDDIERGAGKLLLSQGFRFDAAQNVYLASGDVAIDFWSKGVKELPKEWELYASKPAKMRLRSPLRPRVKVSMSGVNWFELDADFSSEGQSVDLGAVRLWLNSGRRFIPLKDGSYAEADPEQLRRAADLLEEAGALPGKSKTRLPLYQAVALDLLADLGEFAEVEAKARKAIRELTDSSQLPATEPPRGLVATLRHYQEAGLSWLWFLHRHGLSGILADDMGLGKTLQALALLLLAKEKDGKKPSLVVAPTSVLANWEREAERFTPELSVFIWHGQDRRERADQLAEVDLVLTSYALVRRDGEELSKVGFRYVVLDEAQNIKNAGSATAQACKSLGCEHRLALTGTPLENRLSELWSIFDFLMPGFLGSASSFGDRYEHPIQVAGDEEVRQRLKRRISPFVLRRLKTEVAKDLPPKTESVAYCEMDAGQAALYREVLEESRRKVYETIEKVGFKRSRVSILAALMRLRQVCCDPRLLKLPPTTSLPGSAKLERFADLVSDLLAEGHRALVFSQFTEMLELLKRQADEKGIQYQYLDGRTKDRMARVDAFNRDDGPPIFFISLKAGGTGLNLTAADYVIHYDPWWNPAVEDQATDRTHRIGQTKAVISYKLITKGTVEEKILTLQRRKKELAAGVLGGGGGWDKLLTEKDVEELFKPVVD